MKQRSEISVSFRDTETVTEETQTLNLCHVGDIIDVEDVAFELETNVEAYPTASGVPYLAEGGNASGSFSITSIQKFTLPTEAIAAWSAALSSFNNMPKVGWLEIKSGSSTFVYKAAMTSFRPAVTSFVSLYVSASFIVLP